MNKIIFSEEKVTPCTDIQRLASVLGIEFKGKNDKELCLLCQDMIKSIKSDNNRLKFVNEALKKKVQSQNDYLKCYKKKIRQMSELI